MKEKYACPTIIIHINSMDVLSGSATTQWDSGGDSGMDWMW